jgi:hypothetical protein
VQHLHVVFLKQGAAAGACGGAPRDAEGAGRFRCRFDVIIRSENLGVGCGVLELRTASEKSELHRGKRPFAMNDLRAPGAED